MALIQRKTDEEKQVRRDEKAATKEAQENAAAERAFMSSPTGRARAAHQRGDHLLQLSFDVINTTTYTIPMSRTSATLSVSDPSEILNSVCAEGWELINGSFVFLQTGQESRDKFMASGQHVATSGTVLGYYLFRRSGQ